MESRPNLISYARLLKKSLVRLQKWIIWYVVVLWWLTWPYLYCP